LRDLGEGALALRLPLALAAFGDGIEPVPALLDQPVAFLAGLGERDAALALPRPSSCALRFAT
jgi:hypothetical protein